MSDMLALLALVRRVDLGADADSVSLLNYVRIPDGWTQAASDGDLPVDEVLTLLPDGTDHDDLAAIIQGIDEKIRQIDLARKSQQLYGIWLRTQLENETNARQAYVLRGRRGNLRTTHPGIWRAKAWDYILGLTRMPLWEATAETQVPATPGAISIHGGTIACTIGGDALGRVAELTIGDSVGTGSLVEYWFGAKGEEEGITPANFDPVWNLHSGGLSGTDTTIVEDATALGGSKVVCDFGTVTAMDYRAIVQVQQGRAAEVIPDQRGIYIALLRAKTSDAGLVVDVRVGQGYRIGTSNFSFALQPRRTLSAANAGWQTYNLGFVEIPPHRGFPDLEIANAALCVKAQKISGSGNLELDSLILIPAEHYLHLIFTGIMGITRTVYVATLPGGQRIASLYQGTPDDTVVESTSPDAVEWGIPPGDSVIVCAATGGATNTAAYQFTPTLQVLPSYHTLRGAT